MIEFMNGPLNTLPCGLTTTSDPAQCISKSSPALSTRGPSPRIEATMAPTTVLAIGSHQVGDNGRPCG